LPPACVAHAPAQPRRHGPFRSHAGFDAFYCLPGLGGGAREGRETNSVAIASSESFSGWTKTFTDPWLCVAIVDRLTFGCNIIETGTVSYRLAHARAQRAAGVRLWQGADGPVALVDGRGTRWWCGGWTGWAGRCGT